MCRTQHNTTEYLLQRTNSYTLRLLPKASSGIQILSEGINLARDDDDDDDDDLEAVSFETLVATPTDYSS